MDLRAFWSGKRVFLTGHTGFKGTWMCRLLLRAGAELTGYALAPARDAPLFALGAVENDMRSVFGDVRDLSSLKRAFDEARPEIVLHMAAQPLVLEGYRDPAGTYGTNVMGTVNILECARGGGVRSVLNVTTDKVYRNNEWARGYREDETLGGRDPYSNSKSCSELVSVCYRDSFFAESGVALSTARAGNVIGGGDFAANRILPDCVRAALAGRPISVRNPGSVRPYQHVLEPLSAYLTILQRQYEDTSLAGSYNIGPYESGCLTTGQLAERFCAEWGEGLSWNSQSQDGPHEANTLRLDISLIGARLGWRPRWDIATAIKKTVEWHKICRDGGDVAAVMDRQIAAYNTEEGLPVV